MRFMCHRPLFCLFLLAALVFSPAASRAQDKVKILTDINVREFIEKTTSVTAGKESGMSEEDIAEYLEKHIEAGAKFSSHVTYEIPGFSAQEKNISFDKKGFIENIRKGLQVVGKYDTRTEIGDIQVSSDGRKAIVKTAGFEEGVMNVPDENGVEKEVPVDGVSECTQIVSLEKNGVIMMYSATCNTAISFTQL